MLWFEPVFRRGLAVLGIALSASAELSCSSREHPPFEPAQTGGSAGTAVGGADGGNALNVGDASGAFSVSSSLIAA